MFHRPFFTFLSFGRVYLVALGCALSGNLSFLAKHPCAFVLNAKMRWNITNCQWTCSDQAALLGWYNSKSDSVGASPVMHITVPTTALCPQYSSLNLKRCWWYHKRLSVQLPMTLQLWCLAVEFLTTVFKVSLDLKFTLEKLLRATLPLVSREESHSL